MRWRLANRRSASICFDWPNPRGHRPLRGQLRQARRAGRPAHHLEGRQPHHDAGRAAGQARRAATRASSTSTASTRAPRSPRTWSWPPPCSRRPGVIVLDDMLHPGYPTLMVAVHEYLQRHPEMCVLCIDRPRDGGRRHQVRAAAARSGSSATRNACSRPTRTTSGRWAPTSSRTGAWCCRLTPRLADIT